MKPTIKTDRYKLYHSDCMKVLPFLKPESVDAVITDPPYGIDFQSAWRTENERHQKIQNDKAPFVWWLFHASIAIRPGGCLLCFCRWDVAEAFRLAIEWSGSKIGSQIIWDRGNHGLGDLEGRPAPRHDIIWFAVKGKYKLPERRPSTVYQSMRLSGNELDHPNQKPVPLMVSLIRDFTKKNDIILDPFMGSGTTGVAAHQKGRRFIGIEMDDSYFQLSSQRISKATRTSTLDEIIGGDET